MQLRFFFFVFSLFFLLLTNSATNLASAQEPTPTIIPNNEVTQSASIKYDLAYPGILPDHPLYKLKVLRDKIFLALTSDPLKKINFYLRQADKGILATAMLVDKNKIELASQTALKAEHNITLISNIIKSSYNWDQYNSSDTNDLVRKLKNASSKHQEVLNSLLKRVSEDRQKTFETVIYFSKTNIDEIEKTVKDHEAEKSKKKNY